ncbi:MAG: hypothetical protein JHD16_18075 [Solirubrobacteraceae bacterium]|nr:hypothetical protein [Solirubrobacteraceae bacterium]
MSRVLSDTALRRGAALTLVALATTFAACGGDDEPETATTPASSSQTAAPAESASAESGSKDSKESKKGDASEKLPAAPELDKKIATVTAALKKAGLKPQKANEANAVVGTVRLDGATIFLFADVDRAKSAEKQVKKTYKSSKTKALVDRDGKQVFIVRVEGNESVAEAQLDKLRKAASEV